MPRPGRRRCRAVAAAHGPGGAAGARRKCARACGRSSSPSTASTIPSSSAGICRLPSRYRCSTMFARRPGPASAPCAAWRRRSRTWPRSCPRTLTRRAPASALGDLRPWPASTVVMSSRSAGPVPCCSANCSAVMVAGPLTSSWGSSVRCRVTSVTSISLGPIHRAQFLRFRQRTAVAARQRHEGTSRHDRSLAGRAVRSQYVAAAVPGSRSGTKEDGGLIGPKCEGRGRRAVPALEGGG